MRNLFFLFFLFPVLLNAQSDSLDASPKSKALQLIGLCRQKVVSGQSSMDHVARLYSDDPGTAQKGGMLLNVKKGAMVPEFENVAFSLSAGEISVVFETQYGYHFIQLLEHNGETVSLRHVLIMAK